jgi:hypothetical protein
MRWYVNRNGETAGPVEETQIMHWAETGQITRGMSFQAETGGPWLPVEQSPFARYVTVSKPVGTVQARKGTPWWVWVLIPAGGVAMLAFAALDDALKLGPARPAPVEPYIEIDARELVAEYTANEVRADSQFKGRLVSVTGYVRNIQKGALGRDFHVTLDTGEGFSLRSVQCLASEGQSEAAGRLTKGTKAQVRGRVQGLMMNVMLANCEIL